jgi:hypothetical protein
MVSAYAMSHKKSPHFSFYLIEENASPSIAHEEDQSSCSKFVVDWVMRGNILFLSNYI